MGRIVTKEEFSKSIRPELKRQNKTIALCHGVFDLVHPGHMIHFEQASRMADVLVVSITSAPFVRKGPGRPFFDDHQRMQYLSAISYIDYVILSEGYTVDDIIESVEPDLYVKGSEYADEDADVTGMIRKERELVEAHGGRVSYTGGDVYSSTNLINRGLSGLSDELREYMEEFAERYTLEDVRRWSDMIRDLRVLVVGDIIIDQYTYCSVNGLMSKDIGYAARQQSTEKYLGGSLAVARHLSSFTDHITLQSMIGMESGMEEMIKGGIGESIRLELTLSKEVPTIVKHRYLMCNEKRAEYKKIFAINNIPENPCYEESVANEFRQHLSDTVGDYDVVFVCDFGHGLLDRETIQVLQDRAKYLVLNCQTNSSNYGMNIITKYTKANVFTLNQKELKLAYPESRGNEPQAMELLLKHLHADTGYLTRGSQGASSYSVKEQADCPAFALQVKDTVGAGDAFFAVAGAFEAVGAPAEIGMFAGNIAGALEAGIVGNRESVERVNLLKYAGTLMNVRRQ